MGSGKPMVVKTIMQEMKQKASSEDAGMKLRAARVSTMSVVACLLAATMGLGMTAQSSQAEVGDAERCAAEQLRAAARNAKAVLRCHRNAVRDATALSPRCQGRAEARLIKAFAGAENAVDCVSQGEVSMVDEILATVAAEATIAIPEGVTVGARRCALRKLVGAARYAKLGLGCFAKPAKRGLGPEADCQEKGDFVLGSTFTRAEARGGCAAGGDVVTIAVLVDTAVAEVVALVSPVCGDDVSGPLDACDGDDLGGCVGDCLQDCSCFSPPQCGDGVVQSGEECDDGAQMGGDGCSAGCQLEDTSALCAGVPSQSGTAIQAEVVVSGVDRPIYAAAPPLDPNRLFVVERFGRIRILDLATDSLGGTPFLDLHELVSNSNERGLLSVAFHPDYEENGWFFLDYTNADGDTTIARYSASDSDPDLADVDSGRIVLVIEQLGGNHNGGQLAFGPDGYLYVGMGDGGGSGDPDETAQDDSRLLGKILRLDVDVEGSPYYTVPTDNPGFVDGSDPLELIWSKGLRNPWRFSFDRADGSLIIADVGQGSREEVNRRPISSLGGENYGWDIFEGGICFEPDPAPTCPDPATGFTFPIYEYTHSVGCSITGGYVYNGCALPDLHDTYFYSDYCAAFVRTFVVNNGVPTDHADRTSDLSGGGIELDTIVSFAEDARGELYILDFGGGEILRVVPAP